MTHSHRRKILPRGAWSNDNNYLVGHISFGGGALDTLARPDSVRTWTLYIFWVWGSLRKMVAMKVLWDMWRNLTSATANWSFSGPPNGTNVTKPAGVSGGSGNRRRLRYNRLCSGGPTKSRSQPANLAAAAAALEETTLSSSEESLAGWTEAENKLKHSSTFPFQSHVIKQRTSNPKGDTCNDRLTTGNEPKPDQAPLETAWPAANSNGAAKTSSDFGVGESLLSYFFPSFITCPCPHLFQSACPVLSTTCTLFTCTNLSLESDLIN